jgi:hypothetical protein
VTAFQFDPAKYGPAIASLLAVPRLMPLEPGTPDGEPIRHQIAALDVSPACRAGLYLYFDFLDESHTISQDLDTPEGSAWHAIMHRREPDPSNSKYWWRLVGPHPFLDQLREQAPALGYTFTTPETFVEFCERVRGANTPDEVLAKRVQLLEWQLLFDWCWRTTSGTA